MQWLRFPPVLMLLIFAPAAIAWRYHDPVSRPPFLIYGLRWFLGILFTISGLAKLIPGFPNTMGPVNLEYLLAPYGLAPFARFIAISELGIGLLLLTRRYATLGAMTLAPMLLSIIVITSALGWVGTPYLVAGFLLLDLVLLIYDAPKLLPLIGDRPRQRAPAFATLKPRLGWLTLLAVLLIFLGSQKIAGPRQPVVFLVLLLIVSLIVHEWWPDRGEPNQ